MIAIIRIRGSTGIKPAAEKTAELLNLNRINHMVLFNENDSIKGMLKRVKDYVTWGELDRETLTLILKNRMLLKGRKKLTDDYISDLGYKSFEDFADALLNNKTKLKNAGDLIPVIRLNPPRGGYEAIQKPFHEKGSSGYRGEKINNLIKKMIIPGVDLNGENKN